MNRRTVLVATILVLGAGVLVMLVVLTHSPYPARSLPDGSHLSVAFVGYTNRLSHTHYRGTRHQRILNNVIPAKWRQRLGLQNPGSSGFQFGNTASTNLIIVTNQKGGSTNNPIALERIHVVDDDGSVLEAVSDAITLNHPGEIIQGWRFKAFPRREKKVRCRFIYKDSSGNYATAAEMLIPNPTPGPHPVWTSAPAPLTSEDGDLKVTLLDFVAGLSREDEVEAKFRWYWIGRQTTRAVFKIEQPVRERLSWKLQSLSIADAAGNYWKPGLENPLGNTNGDGSLVAEFIGALWPSEPAWKLRAELSRTSNFTSDELCTLPDVAVPFTNQVVTLNTAHEVNGNTLHIVTVGGMGAELPDPYRSLASAKAVNLAVRMQPGAHRLSLVRVADGEGRLIPFSEPYPWFEDNRCFALEAAAGVGKLKITFAIHRSRFVEFTAKPKQVGKPSK